MGRWEDRKLSHGRTRWENENMLSLHADFSRAVRHSICMPSISPQHLIQHSLQTLKDFRLSMPWLSRPLSADSMAVPRYQRPLGGAIKATQLRVVDIQIITRPHPSSFSASHLHPSSSSFLANHLQGWIDSQPIVPCSASRRASTRGRVPSVNQNRPDPQVYDPILSWSPSLLHNSNRNWLDGLKSGQ